MGEVGIQTALDWRGHTVVDAGGEKIGKLKEIYLDQDERPAWGSVHTGLFGLRETLVPLTEARPEGGELRVPFEGDHVKAAPNVDPEVQLTPEQEDELYRHYGMAGEREGIVAGEQEGAVAARERAAGEQEGAVAAREGAAGEQEGAVAARERAADEQEGAVAAREGAADEQEGAVAAREGAGADAAPAEQTDDAMTRSEEEVRIGKRVRPTERVRLKKYVVTDYVEKKVPVQREEIRLEREPPEEGDPGR
jgi:stress response protein YsnF